MKRIISLIMSLTLVFAALALTSCGGTNPEEGSYTRMTVDINPSIELMIDDDGKVASVTALNDDGAVIVAGEAIVGKTPEEALELVLTVATDTGYLVKGNAEVGDNTVKLSVSGDSAYAKKLAASIESKAKKVLDSLDIEGKIEKAEALTSDALRALALECGSYTEEELADMSDDQLCAVIAESRIETALLLTEELREAYNAAKAHRITFAESEATAAVIKELGGIYAITHTAYKSALDLYSSAIDALDELRYSTLVDPDSEYQKALVSLREAKTELLTQRTYTASLEKDGEEYASASVTLALSEEKYNKAITAFEQIGKAANDAILALIDNLEEAEAALVELEETLFDDNIEKTLKEKASELEAAVNSAKDSFFADFEAAHGDDISAIESSLLAKKQELKDKIAK